MMQRLFYFGLVLLVMGIALPCEGGVFRRLGAPSHPWHFDGREFVPGTGDGSLVLLLRDGYLPVVQGGTESTPSVPLPEGRGGIAGICYFQVAGGKLTGLGGILPADGCRVEILDASGAILRVMGDLQGFFSLLLPAGQYEARTAGNRVSITVAAGMTTLVALRAGKRMVD